MIFTEAAACGAQLSEAASRGSPLHGDACGSALFDAGSARSDMAARRLGCAWRRQSSFERGRAGTLRLHGGCAQRAIERGRTGERPDVFFGSLGMLFSGDKLQTMPVLPGVMAMSAIRLASILAVDFYSVTIHTTLTTQMRQSADASYADFVRSLGDGSAGVPGHRH